MELPDVGLHLNFEQASEAARTVSVDRTGHSVSFNEYLKLVSNERKSEPDEDALLNMFKSMDPKDKGYLMEEDLRKLLKGKSGISADDVEEMITEYKALGVNCKASNSDLDASDVIFYKGKEYMNKYFVSVSLFFRFCDNASVLTLLFNLSNFVNKFLHLYTSFLYICLTK